MTFLRSFTGPLTGELVRQPGQFGLGQVPAKLAPVGVAKAVCGFCSTGCGLTVHLDAEGTAVNLTPSPDYPVNLGMACPKGWEALTVLDAADRATTPLLHGVPVDWATAATEFALRFKVVQAKHGPHSVAWLSTGQIMTEEMALLGAFARYGMGLRHGDGNTRQCMATSVVAHKEAFGFDAPPYSYADFEESDVLVFFGANPCIAHPIMWQRVLRNTRSPEIIVVDPRFTETAMCATQHVGIAPKQDLTLLYCLAHWLIAHERTDPAFIAASTTGFAEFKTFVQDYAPETYIDQLGITRECFYQLAESIGSGKRVSLWWTMGINQGHEAVRTAQAIINLALLTGNIGKPGTGANSITGQCNAMGSRLFSNTTNMLGGHAFENPQHRAKVAQALDLPSERIAAEGGWAYDQIIDGIHDGSIKGLWMIATNGAHSWINSRRFQEAAAKLEFFVVQDMYASTETAALAHLMLPAAGWGEKEGTFINSERRIGLSRKVKRPPGLALADFSIIRLLAEYWGCGGDFSKWKSPEAAFQILQELSAGQPCDITGVEGYAHLERSGGIQWPLVAGEGGQIAKERRLFADGRFYHADGKARFCYELPRAVPEPVDADYPFALLTGRGTSSQWHTGSRTNKSAILRKLHPQDLAVELHPDDAVLLGIETGDLVDVETRRGKITVAARLLAGVGRGQLYLPMHEMGTNLLTLTCVDPYSRQPSYKHCAARVRLKK